MTETVESPREARPASSRTSKKAAGWECTQIGTFTQLEPQGQRPKFSWLRPSVLWAARNDPLSRRLGDPTNGTRLRWVASQVAGGADPDFRIDRTDLGASCSFIVIGDTGEGDHSQYAVVPGLLRAAGDTSFMVLMSDVIYPTGGVNDYVDKFFRPYQNYPAPIYAVPGNHDWYDGLTGFMRVFCGADPLPPEDDAARPLSKAWLRDRLWSPPATLADDTLERCRELRPAPEQQSTQPGPYWILDAGPLMLVGIDTGIDGTLDGDQGEWLRRVSKAPKPKILITGKPLYVDNEHHPGPIEGGGTVDDVVRDPANRYVAAIGGDIHNYQRYPVRVGDRTIQYVVSGGGGAFMHATHTIEKVDVQGVSEDEFKCYPLRGDSLAFYSRLYDQKLFRRGLLRIEPEQASALLAERCGVRPTRPSDAKPTRATRAKALALGLLPSGRTFHRYISEFFDSDQPPLFKSFLRFDVTASEARVRCYAATGCLEQELEPPLEDEFTIPLEVR